MGSDLSEPNAEVLNSLDETVAALQAIQNHRTCRGALGELRTKFGACAPEHRSASPASDKKGVPPAVKIAAVTPGSP